MSLAYWGQFANLIQLTENGSGLSLRFEYLIPPMVPALYAPSIPKGPRFSSRFPDAWFIIQVRSAGLTAFWQELKLRMVMRVVITYGELG